MRDGHASEDASAENTALINALRNGGDLLNVFGDFPTLRDPRHADAYSPLWDAQLGLWTQKAVNEGLNTRQIDEVVVFNLAATPSTQPQGRPLRMAPQESTSTVRSSGSLTRLRPPILPRPSRTRSSRQGSQGVASVDPLLALRCVSL
ncbi:MAG: hypothetical protein E6J36_07410 [Chloroflexi bacterium]|nr:MAG: hypothetical protein E6J36_07410 [Chloroflexota bacterium]